MPLAAAAEPASRRRRFRRSRPIACNGSAETYEADKGNIKWNRPFQRQSPGKRLQSCHTLLVNTNEALKSMSVPFEAEYVTDMTQVASYGVMSTPALVVNEKVVSMGKVYNAAEVEKLLHKLGYWAPFLSAESEQNLSHLLISLKLLVKFWFLLILQAVPGPALPGTVPGAWQEHPEMIYWTLFDMEVILSIKLWLQRKEIF